MLLESNINVFNYSLQSNPKTYTAHSAYLQTWALVARAFNVIIPTKNINLTCHRRHYKRVHSQSLPEKM